MKELKYQGIPKNFQKKQLKLIEPFWILKKENMFHLMKQKLHHKLMINYWSIKPSLMRKYTKV